MCLNSFKKILLFGLRFFPIFSFKKSSVLVRGMHRHSISKNEALHYFFLQDVSLSEQKYVWIWVWAGSLRFSFLKTVQIVHRERKNLSIQKFKEIQGSSMLSINFKGRQYIFWSNSSIVMNTFFLPSTCDSLHWWTLCTINFKCCL